MNKDSYLILDTLPAEYVFFYVVCVIILFGTYFSESRYDARVKAMEVDERPSEAYDDIGGLDKQIQELVEAVVLPITHKVLLSCLI